MGLPAYSLLQILREFYMRGEEVRRSIEWIIHRIIKVASRFSYRGRNWWVHVASAFPLGRHYRELLGHRLRLIIS